MSPHGETPHLPEFLRDVSTERPSNVEPIRRSREMESARVIPSALEKRARRTEDARRFVDVAIRAAGGDMEAVRRQIFKHLQDAREQVGKPEHFNHAAQERIETLRAQRDEIAARLQQKASAERTSPAADATTKEVPATEADPERASAWKRLTGWMFGDRGSRQEEPQTRYEQTWTPAKLDARASSRQREEANIQEHAVDSLTNRQNQTNDRLAVIQNILSGSRQETLPPAVRSRYERERDDLLDRKKEIGTLLNIAASTRRTSPQQEQKRA